MNYLDKLWLRTLSEIDRVSGMLTVLLLIKNGEVAGRITARRTKHAVNVALIIYADNAFEMGIFGCARMTGDGYDRTNAGIAEILASNKHVLRERLNVNLEGQDWQIMGTWRRNFEKAGFTVIQAI